MAGSDRSVQDWRPHSSPIAGVQGHYLWSFCLPRHSRLCGVDVAALHCQVDPAAPLRPVRCQGWPGRSGWRNRVQPPRSGEGE